jgi:predicted house-cleaning noncanonical NTP pyrophosphatase (MazG superfamily)
MVKIYAKLVRDNIPAIIAKDGKTCKTRLLNQEDYIKALDAKLIEEMKEYQESKDIHELADLEEVLKALVIAKGYTPEEFEAIRLGKEKTNGGFEKKIFLESVDDGK